MNGFKNRRLQWSLKTFIACVLVTACLLAFGVSRFNAQYEMDGSVLGPLTSGDRVEMGPLSTSEVLWALERLPTDKKPPAGFRVSKLDVREVDKFSDPPKVIPLIGNAQMHHTIYRCKVLGKTPDGTSHSLTVHIDHINYHMLPPDEVAQTW